MDDSTRHLPVRTDDELLERWRLIMTPDGFDRRSLWVVWFDRHGEQLPVVVPVDDLPVSPDGELLDGLGDVVGGILDGQADGGSVAMAISRPGPSAIEDGDRSWGRALLDMAHRNGIHLRRLHLATAGSVRPLVGDDLV